VTGKEVIMMERQFGKADFSLRTSHGFGLIELMVAVAILGVLAYFAIPVYQDYLTRSRVAEALELADAAREPVEEAFAAGVAPPADLLDSGGKAAGHVTALTWMMETGGGHILAAMDLPRLGQRNVLALELRIGAETHNWHCVSAAKVGAANPLEEKYLPATCQGDGAVVASVKQPPPATSQVVSAGSSVTTCPPAGEPDKSELIGGQCVVPCPKGLARGNDGRCHSFSGPTDPNKQPHASATSSQQGGTSDPQPLHCNPPQISVVWPAAISPNNQAFSICADPCLPGESRDPANPSQCVAAVPSGSTGATRASMQGGTCPTGMEVNPATGKCAIKPLPVTQQDPRCPAGQVMQTVSINRKPPVAVPAPGAPYIGDANPLTPLAQGIDLGEQQRCGVPCPDGFSPSADDPTQCVKAGYVMHACRGPVFICERSHRTTAVSCPAERPYPANVVGNLIDGSRYVARTCVSAKEAFEHSAYNANHPQCGNYDVHDLVDSVFTCVFPCVGDNCNIETVPKSPLTWNDQVVDPKTGQLRDKTFEDLPDQVGLPGAP
jgi:type IV pilus assembly protein PilA